MWGLRNNNIKKRLLGEGNLTYQRAVELATTLDMAAKDVASMENLSRSSANEINFVTRDRQGPGYQSSNDQKDQQCLRCEGRNHRAAECRYRQYKCNLCTKVGHLGRVCKNSVEKKNCNDDSNKGEIKTVKRKKSYKRNNVNYKDRQNYVDDASVRSVDFDDIFHVENLNAVSNEGSENELGTEPVIVKVNVQGAAINFQLDTGAVESVISERDFAKRRELASLSLNATQRRFKTHSGEIIRPCGVLNVVVTLLKVSEQVQLYVVPGCGPPLLGRSWFGKLGIPLAKFIMDRADTGINNIAESEDADIISIVKNFDALFRSLSFGTQ